MLRPLTFLLAIATPLAAQDPSSARVASAARLSQCIERPYAYLSLVGGPEPADEGEARRCEAVRDLLANPALDRVFVGAAAGRESGAARSLAMVRGMLGRGARDLELILTGVLPGGGQPLLVLRARLHTDQADRLRLVLTAGGKLATPLRRVGEHQTYSLRAGDGARPAGPGQVVELALLGDDLLVGNDGTAMQEVLQFEDGVGTSAASRQVLANDARFVALRERVDLPSGSLLAYGDWRRLGRRLAAGAGGVPAELLGSSGLAKADSVLVSIAPAEDDDGAIAYVATLLLGFDRSDTGASVGRQSVRREIGGWFAARQPLVARDLVRELPRSGLGGLVLSVDLKQIAACSPRSSHMVWELREAYDEFGLDFDRNLLERLGTRGTVQLHFDRAAEAGDAAEVAAVSAVYTIRATSRSGAQGLFDDLCRVVAGTRRGDVRHVARKGHRDVQIVELRGARRAMNGFVALHGDSLLLSQREDALLQAHDELQQARSGRRDPSTARALKAIGGERVAGLFDVDLEPLLHRLGLLLPGVHFDSLPRRHVGCLDAEDEGDMSVVRVRLLSSH